MKRKPNSDASASPGGGSSGTAGSTSGQSVQKSKFRQKSNQEKTAASKLRMEKRGKKLEQAKEKLSKQKPPKKPGPIRQVGRAAGGTVHGFVHGKIFEVEQENVGTEGAHRSELVGETALRRGSRFIKKKVREHPAKAVQRAESKYIKATADYHFKMAAQEYPEMTRNPVSRSIRSRQSGLGSTARGRPKRPPPPRKRPGPRRWALSSGIPWGCSWPWFASCSCL